MALNPHVLRHAQEELDRVLGGERLPDFSDQDNLPYISAIVKELFRWGCPFPIGVPKRVTEDDTYNGYFIPAGATVFENVWFVDSQNVWTSTDDRPLIKSHAGKCSTMRPSTPSLKALTRDGSSKTENSILLSRILKRAYLGWEEGAGPVTMIFLFPPGQVPPLTVPEYHL